MSAPERRAPHLRIPVLPGQQSPQCGEDVDLCPSPNGQSAASLDVRVEDELDKLRAHCSPQHSAQSLKPHETEGFVGLGDDIDGLNAAVRGLRGRLSVLESHRPAQESCQQSVDVLTRSLRHLHDSHVNLRQCVAALEKKLSEKLEAGALQCSLAELEQTLRSELLQASVQRDAWQSQQRADFSTLRDDLNNQTEALRDHLIDARQEFASAQHVRTDVVGQVQQSVEELEDKLNDLSGKHDEVRTSVRKSLSNFASKAALEHMLNTKHEDMMATVNRTLADVDLRLVEVTTMATQYADRQHEAHADKVMGLVKDLDQRLGAELAQVQANADAKLKSYHTATSESLHTLDEGVTERVGHLASQLEDLDRVMVSRITQACNEQNALQTEQRTAFLEAQRDVNMKFSAEVTKMVSDMSQEGDEKLEGLRQEMNELVVAVAHDDSEKLERCVLEMGQMAADVVRRGDEKLERHTAEINRMLADMARDGDEKLTVLRGELHDQVLKGQQTASASIKRTEAAIERYRKEMSQMVAVMLRTSDEKLEGSKEAMMRLVKDSSEEMKELSREIDERCHAVYESMREVREDVLTSHTTSQMPATPRDLISQPSRGMERGRPRELSNRRASFIPASPGRSTRGTSGFPLATTSPGSVATTMPGGKVPGVPHSVPLVRSDGTLSGVCDSVVNAYSNPAAVPSLGPRDMPSIGGNASAVSSAVGSVSGIASATVPAPPSSSPTLPIAGHGRPCMTTPSHSPRMRPAKEPAVLGSGRLLDHWHSSSSLGASPSLGSGASPSLGPSAGA